MSTPDYFHNLEHTMRFPLVVYHGPIRQAVHRAIAAEGARRNRPLDILNVGCGLSQVLAGIDLQHAYTGVDIDVRSVEACRERWPRGTFQVCGPVAIPLADASFDVVFSTEVVEHTADPVAWLSELVRVARPGALIQLSTPDYGHWTLPLAESTMLEVLARAQGFTREGIHPLKLCDASLRAVMHAAGLRDVTVESTPLRLALVAQGRKAP